MAPSYSQLSEPSLLFVEDDDDWAFIFQSEFKKIAPDRILLTVRNGDEAIRYLAVNNLQILVTDIRLPGVDGVEIIRWVKTQPRFQTLPIVVHTSSQEISHRQRCEALGVNSYLEKPSSMDALRANIQLIIKLWDESVVRPLDESGRQPS